MSDKSSCRCVREVCVCSDSHSFSRVVFLDWDDTLLASSELCRRGLKPQEFCAFPKDVTMFLEKLEESVIDLLSTMSSKAIVYIITNSTDGWVELSCARYFPKLLPLLSNIKIISARSQYEHECENGTPYEWKRRCFEDIFKWFKDNQPSSTFEVISIGDSESERHSCLYLQHLHSGVITKCIKFDEFPSLPHLQRQLDLLKLNLMKLLRSHQKLDLSVTLKNGTTAANAATC
ncbi:hypothetical protein P9112_006833 [Eukaryota sp. TZLM1-RC]